MFKAFIAFLILPFFAIASQIDLVKAQMAVVFVAVERSPFDLVYGPDSGYCECLRSFYDFFYPPSLAHGSGFVISPEGHVVTNSHVVKDATSVIAVIRTPDIQVCKATVLGRDPRCDIAVLKLELEDGVSLPYLTFGDSDLEEIGNPVFRLGNPEIFDSSVTTGVISAKHRNFYDWLPIEGYLQTDAVCAHGNSGGPVLNAEGEVIGVSCLGILGEGLNFEIPSNTASAISQQIMKKGKITQGFLGIRLEDNSVTPFDCYYFDRYEGARIGGVIVNSPALAAGFKRGDLIVECNGKPVLSSADLRNKIAVLPEYTEVSMKAYRGDDLLEFYFKLGSDQSSKHYANLIGAPIKL